MPTVELHDKPTTERMRGYLFTSPKYLQRIVSKEGRSVDEPLVHFQIMSLRFDSVQQILMPHEEVFIFVSIPIIWLIGLIVLWIKGRVRNGDCAK